jgi:uncharacterized coiled-coil protein SlyX
MCSATLAAESPATLEEIREMLRQQQEIIEQQQDQIEALQRQTGVQPAAPTPAASAPPVASAYDAPARRSSGLSWEGYGVVNYQNYDFYENVQDDQPDRRARTDLERIVFAPSYDFGNGYSFVAEIEFEHGGTGSSVEFEPEEAGEFETETEHGGEVILEQAYLQLEYKPFLNFRFGEMIVPFGMVNTHHEPTQYFTLERSLAETNLFPSVWHETGIGVLGELGRLRYESQIISALDSSGFSGPFFVAGGTQDQLEFDNADDLAFVARVDYPVALGATLGAAFYIGDSTDNRPRQNLDGDALVTLYEAHGRYERGPLIVRGQYTAGTIDNSDAITQANLNFFNGDVLGVSRTPVGHMAESWFLETGYDIFSLFSRAPRGRFDIFGRYEVWNTHADTEGNIAAVDRYDRDAGTLGVNYKPQPGIVFKAEYQSLTHQGDTGNEQDIYGLGFGFEF